MRRALVIVTIVVAFAASAFVIRRSMASPGTSSVSGELVETYCWGSLQIGGPAHASCGIECAKRGIPLAVYDKDERKAFILLPGKDKTSLPPELIAAMGKQITVRGDLTTRGGVAFMLVHSWELKS